MTLRPSETLIFTREFNGIHKIDVFDPKMVLGASWGSLGLLLGALGGLLGDLWGLQIDQKALTRSGPFRCGALFGLFFLLLAAADGLESVLGPSWAPFWCSWGPLGGSFGVLRIDFELQN